MHNWTKGDYLTHRFNPELGIGRVAAIEGRALVVEFPRAGTRLRLAANTDALIPVDPDSDRSRLDVERPLTERLTRGDVDDAKEFLTRLDVLHLLSLRETDALGSFLGGRVRLFPHQLYVAERASASEPVRCSSPTRSASGRRLKPR